MKIRVGIGQDSHRFVAPEIPKPLIIGGLIFDDLPGFLANSDGDVVIHALCNAISSITGVLILGGVADELCFNQGITDSACYLQEALKTLGNKKITHVAITIEAYRPKLKGRLLEMRTHLAALLNLELQDVGITATSGEGLTDFGCGDGVQAMAIITTQED